MADRKRDDETVDWVLMCPKHGVRADLSLVSGKERPTVAGCSLLEPGTSCAQSCMKQFLQSEGETTRSTRAAPSGWEETTVRRIMIPVEDVNVARTILGHVLPFLTKPGTEALLLRVVQPLATPEKTERRLADARSDLDRLLNFLLLNGATASAQLFKGDPADVILEQITEQDASLTVMATHTRLGLARIVRGSVVERVLRQANAPLLLFNPSSLATVYRKIIVPLDGSEAAARILPLVEEVARTHHSEVVLLRVGMPPNRPSGFPEDRATLAIREGELEDSLEGPCQTLQNAGLSARVRVTFDTDVARAILDSVDAEGADLVALTSHGRSPLELWPFGAVAEKILRNCSAALLVQRVAGLAPPRPSISAAPPSLSTGRHLRLLVPQDGSPLAEAIVHTLPVFLQGREAELTLLRVVELAAHPAPAKDQLTRLQQVVTDRGIADCTTKVVHGDPTQQILIAASPETTDLVVMSTHGRGGVERWIRGSVAERVLRRCEVPLFLCTPAAFQRGGWGGSRPFRRILVPLDGSRRSASILPHVQDLALSHRAEVVLFRVQRLPGNVPSSLLTATRGQLARTLLPYRALLAEAGVDAHVRIGFGREADRILREAGTADVVAMTTHGRGGAARWMLGSVAEQVIRRCARPLLLTRAGEGEPQRPDGA